MTGENLTLDWLLDPQNPFLLTGVLPAAVLGAVGLRKLAVLWVMAAVVWQMARAGL